MPKTLKDISREMRDIDFCTLSTHSGDGSISARPMSNNRNVDYEGDSWFFTYDDRLMVRDIEKDANVGISYLGSAGLMGIVGKPGMFIHVEGEARLVRDKAKFAEHWRKELEIWFEQGIDTPGLVLIEVAARRIHYWDGMDEGEVRLPATAAA